jgi:hypothetical protein
MTLEKAKPLINVYVYGPVIGFDNPEASGFAGHGRRDAFGAVSLDDGETWKVTNLSNSADQSSFIVSTPLPRDSDGDGDGNLCDADLDNTGFVDFPDLTLFQTAFFTADPDADFNGDAFVDFRDLTIFDFSFFQAPGPSCVDLPGGCTPLMCKESWNLVGVFYKNDWCLFVQFSLSHYPKSSFNFWRQSCFVNGSAGMTGKSQRTQ